jgi:hypothetical protein
MTQTKIKKFSSTFKDWWAREHHGRYPHGFKDQMQKAFEAGRASMLDGRAKDEYRPPEAQPAAKDYAWDDSGVAQHDA